MHKEATLVISFDVELGWGAIENRKWYQKEKQEIFIRTRHAVRSLVELFETTNTVATWAFLGKLLDDDGLSSELLPDDVRGICEQQHTLNPPTWRGTDLLEIIRRSRVDHEIGCHSFFHCRYQAEWVSQAFIHTDLLYCQDVFAKYGLPLTSFVFPSNQQRELAALQDIGIRCYRGENRHEIMHIQNRILRKMYGLARHSGWARLRWEEPFESQPGLLCLPGTVLYSVKPWRKKFLSGLQRRVLHGLQDAIRHGKYFHIWSHPYNFAELPELIDAFGEILGWVQRARDRGHLVCLTMGQYAEQWFAQKGGEA